VRVAAAAPLVAWAAAPSAREPDILPAPAVNHATALGRHWHGSDGMGAPSRASTEGRSAVWIPIEDTA